MLSDSPEAIRSRRYRAHKRASSASSVNGHAPAPHAAARQPSSRSLHETVPISGPGPEAFARPPVLPANDNAPGEPFAPPPPAPEAPPPTPDEVKGIALAVAAYFQAGCVALVAKHHEALAQVVDIQGLASKLPVATEFVRGAAERVAIKYGLRLPYQDEIVVAGALGLASFGFFGGKPKASSSSSSSSSRDAVKHAKDANPAQPRDARGEPDRGAATPPTPTGDFEW